MGREPIVWIRLWSACTPWRLTALVLGIDAIWMLCGGWTIAWTSVGAVLLLLLACTAPLALTRYRKNPRISTTLNTTAQFIAVLATTATLSYLFISTNAPLADASLDAWDRSLGFDWLALYQWLQQHPALAAVLHHAYQSGLVQLVVVVLLLGIGGRAARLDEFMRLYILAALFTIVVSALVPAAGAWKYHAPSGPFTLASLSHFEPLRDGRMREIPLHGQMQGLVAMPSFHAANAVLLVHAMRGIRLWLPVFALLNTAMLVSTPIDGGHYLVDVIAGVALALALIALNSMRGAGRLGQADASAPRH